MSDIKSQVEECLKQEEIERRCDKGQAEYYVP